MAIPIFVVDAFASGPFSGNPAAVCLPGDERDADWMQCVASEMNLSETAFVRRVGDEFDLRWFTPASEVPLCGHATLASSHVLWETGRADGPVRFHTLSGTLTARRAGPDVEIDLPAQPVVPVTLPGTAWEALGFAGEEGVDRGPGRGKVSPRFVGRTPDRGLGDLDYLIELESDEEVRSLAPRFDLLREVPGGFIVTAEARGEQDYVCRYFAPWWGIDEDPVTGAAHCALAPFWSDRVRRADVVGYQASARGGTVRARVAGERVLLAGRAVTVLRGELLT